MHLIMKVVTLRNLSPELAAKLRHESQQHGASLAKTVVRLLEERLGIGQALARRSDADELDRLAGSWTANQAEEFDDTLSKQRTIDRELW